MVQQHGMEEEQVIMINLGQILEAAGCGSGHALGLYRFSGEGSGGFNIEA